jgi:regulator of sigma E protease
MLSLAAPAPDRAGALALADDIALAPDFDTNRVIVTHSSAAEAAGLQDGDRLLRIDGAMVGTWEDIREHTDNASKRGTSLELHVQREALPGSAPAAELVGSAERLTLDVEPSAWAVPEYGVYLRQALYEYRAESIGEAFQVGIQGSWKFLVDAWNTIKRMLLGQVSASNVGGIISIGVVSYSWASLGLAKLLFFLCMLSMNLAFLNVLPIPILDGGHLLFLAIEKIKGSPVSDRVFGYSQLVGIVLILSLMIFVTFNDLRRWAPGLFD